MNGLCGLNKSPDGVVIGLVQMQGAVVTTKACLAAQTEKICATVARAKRSMPATDLVVFPEYALQGGPAFYHPDILSCVEGPEVAAFKDVCASERIWGCFSIMEYNPYGNPYNSGIVVDDMGTIKLYYRKMHPWVPVEPWAPGDLGVPVCDGPNGSKLSLAICHDGMFPEFARAALIRGLTSCCAPPATLRRCGIAGGSPIKPTHFAT